MRFTSEHHRPHDTEHNNDWGEGKKIIIIINENNKLNPVRNGHTFILKWEKEHLEFLIAAAVRTHKCLEFCVAENAETEREKQSQQKSEPWSTACESHANSYTQKQSNTLQYKDWQTNPLQARAHAHSPESFFYFLCVCFIFVDSTFFACSQLH